MSSRSFAAGTSVSIDPCGVSTTADSTQEATPIRIHGITFLVSKAVKSNCFHLSNSRSPLVLLRTEDRYGLSLFRVPFNLTGFSLVPQKEQDIVSAGQRWTVVNPSSHRHFFAYDDEISELSPMKEMQIQTGEPLFQQGQVVGFVSNEKVVIQPARPSKIVRDFDLSDPDLQFLPQIYRSEFIRKWILSVLRSPNALPKLQLIKTMNSNERIWRMSIDQSSKDVTVVREFCTENDGSYETSSGPVGGILAGGVGGIQSGGVGGIQSGGVGGEAVRNSCRLDIVESTHFPQGPIRILYRLSRHDFKALMPININDLLRQLEAGWMPLVSSTRATTPVSSEGQKLIEAVDHFTSIETNSLPPIKKALAAGMIAETQRWSQLNAEVLIQLSNQLKLAGSSQLSDLDPRTGLPKQTWSRSLGLVIQKVDDLIFKIQSVRRR